MRSARKSADATSAFVRPAATSSATRSFGRGQPLDARAAADAPQLLLRPLGPAGCAELLECHVGRSIASRAGRFSRARRRVAPSARSARPRPKSSPAASCAGRPPRAGRGPPARRRERRQRGRGTALHARAPRRGRADARPPPTRRARVTASSTRPSSSSASTCSIHHQHMFGSALSPGFGMRSAASKRSAAAAASPLQSSIRPWTPNGPTSRVSCSSARRTISAASSRARLKSPRCAAMSAAGKKVVGGSAPACVYAAASSRDSAA